MDKIWYPALNVTAFYENEKKKWDTKLATNSSSNKTN